MRENLRKSAGTDRLAAMIVAGFGLARIAYAQALGRSVDESYTRAICRTLSLSYYGHPPLHRWIVHFAAGALGEGLGARLPIARSPGAPETFALSQGGEPAIELAIVPVRGLTRALPLPYPGGPGR